MNTLSIPPLIMAGITLYLGIFHLLIYSRQRQERQHLTFALTCGVMALYDVFSAGLYNVTSAAQGVHWQRAQVATLALLSITFPWFVVDYFARVSPLSSRAKRWIGASSVYFALAAVVGMVDRSGLVRPLDRPAVKEIQLLWGSRVTYYEMEPGPLTNLQSLMGLVLFVYILWLSVGIYRKGHREAWPLLGAMILFFGAAVNDTAVASGLYPFVYVMEYAYMGMVLLMTYALTGAVVESAMTKEALRESEEQYRTLFEASPESITLVGLNGMILNCNAATAEIAGLPREDIIGKPFTELGILSEKDVPQYMELFARIWRGETISPVQLGIIQPDHETRWLEVFPGLLAKDGAGYAIQIITRDITERKQAEEALRESEERYRQSVESSPNPIFAVDREGIIQTWNEACEQTFQHRAEEIIGQSYHKLLWSPEDHPTVEDALTYVWQGHSRSSQDMTYRCKDETQRFTVSRLYPLRDREGSVQGCVFANTDITERVRAEQALRESETRLRALSNATFEGIGFAEQGIVVDVNQQLADMLAYEMNELQGMHVSKFVAPEDRELVRSVMLAGSEEPYEHRALRKDGSTIFVEVRPRMMLIKGRPVRVTAIRDITERKRAEAEILRLQHLLQNITDSMPSALITLNPAGQVLTWNPAAEAMTGRATNQVQGQLLWETCPELVRYRDMFERVVGGDPVVHLHKDQLATEAGTIYHDVSAFPLEANEIEGVVLRIDDVTRRVQLEEMMLQSAKMASVGGLAAGIAHEINNPLGAIMQSAQMLQMGLDTQRSRTRERLQECGVDPEGLDGYLQERGLLAYLDGIRDTGGRAAKIVSDLLSFSRKSSSKTAPRNLNQLVQQALDLAVVDYDLTKKYDFRDIEVVYDLDPGLPNIICDGQQIQQVVLNLVRNAAQAMAEKIERGGRDWQPRLTLCTSFQIENRESKIPNRVRLQVEDNGPGIPEAVKERLFEPFFTTKDLGEGMGLGLWLCWSIVVERHGGSIEVESTVGRGSTFTVSLPVAGDQYER